MGMIAVKKDDHSYDDTYNDDKVQNNNERNGFNTINNEHNNSVVFEVKY